MEPVLCYNVSNGERVAFFYLFHGAYRKRFPFVHEKKEIEQ